MKRGLAFTLCLATSCSPAAVDGGTRPLGAVIALETQLFFDSQQA